MSKYHIHSGLFFEAQAVKSLLLLCKLSSWFWADLKSFYVVNWELHEVYLYQK